MTAILSTVCLTASSHIGKVFLARHQQWVDDIKQAIQQLPAQATVVFLDVGANNGGWTKGVLNDLGWCIPHNQRVCGQTTNMPALKLFVFEPNPVFGKTLTSIVRHVQGRLVPAAAWTEETRLTLYTQQGTSDFFTSTVDLGVASNRALGHNYTVQAIDFERFAADVMRGADLVVLKLDVEGAEYTLLPRLLMSGLLCRVHFLQVEWHLQSLPHAQRLFGLNLRNTFEPLLQRGCVVPPRKVFIDEIWGNGRGFGGAVLVPGLQELAKLYGHDSTKVNRTSKPTRPTAKQKGHH